MSIDATKLSTLRAQVAALSAATASGNLPKAKATWLDAHVTWLEIGQDDGAYGCFGPLGAFATNETKTEVFEDVRLSIDTSSIFWNKTGIWDTYVGYRYWYNKFGVNHNAALFSTLAPGTAIESTAYVGTTYHFK